jgi:hypothetical protein
MTRVPRLLVKLHPQVSLAAVERRASIRPLFEEAPAAGLGLVGDAGTWYIAEVADGGPTPWDMAHSQVAAALGVGESDVLFAEPDLEQHYPSQNSMIRTATRESQGPVLHGICETNFHSSRWRGRPSHFPIPDERALPILIPATTKSMSQGLCGY